MLNSKVSDVKKEAVKKFQTRKERKL